MLKTRGRLSVAFVCLAFGWSPLLWAQQAAQAQTGRAGAAGAPARVATATRAEEAPILDGLLEERSWQQAVPLTEFVQTEPFEGRPATERTEVRLLYDDKAVYVGVSSSPTPRRRR